MYESMTFETILQRMLDRIDDAFDKREGSIIYDALAPAAIELQNLYFELDRMIQEAYADTASRDFLIARAAERGIVPKAATYAVRRGVFNTDIPAGSRFSLNKLNYISGEKISDGIFEMTCETAGEVGNTDRGSLVPIDYIDGLITAELTDIITAGTDEEDTEVFRTRYFDSLDAQAFGGNVADYKETVTAMTGVGGVKVIPIWNGPGTVKIIITDSAYGTPEEKLISRVQENLDPAEYSGTGVGLAPIGHKVTVVGADTKTIDINISVSVSEDFTWEDIRPSAEKAIDTYFSELASNWAHNDRLTVRISQIESRLLDIDGILDVAETELNGIKGNLVLQEYEIPVRGNLHAATAL